MGIELANYEGFQTRNGILGAGGFSSTPGGEVDELQKALSAGYQQPRHSGGAALQVESLEATMRVLTFNQQHVRLWRDIPKTPAFSTAEEYTIQRSYGGESGMFTREGELPQEQDADYARKVAFVKFCGTQREVTHVATLVKPAHGNLIALETQNGAVWLMERLERALFFGNSAIVSESFDGLLPQIQMDPTANARNILDARNGIWTEDLMEEATQVIVDAYGVPSDCYLAPKALSQLTKQFYPKERAGMGGPADGRVGFAVNKFTTNAGDINLKSDTFLRSGKNNGVKTPPLAATSPRAPTAPTIALAANAGPVTGSQFASGDIGAFRYVVSAINRFGESAKSAAVGAVSIVAALDANTVTITDGGGSDTATGYRIYRTKVGGAAGSEQLVTEIPRASAAAATTAWQDLNAWLPGCSMSFLLQMNLQSMAFRQLAPMLKFPLATISVSIRWAQVLYGTLILYAPERNVVVKNLNDGN